MKRFLTCILLIYALVFMTACPSEKTIRTFKESSAKMKIFGIKLIDANIDAFNAGEISKPDFIALNEVTAKYVEAIKIYDIALKETEAIIKDSKTLPQTALDKLSRVFNEQVVAAFFKVIEILNILPNANSETVKTIIASIRLTILAISSALSEARVQGEQIYV